MPMLSGTWCKSIILLTTCAAVAHCVLESSPMGSAPALNAAVPYGETMPDKSEQETMIVHKRPSFFVGSRYGRSNGGSYLASSKIRRLNVAPRNDRFFLGSRYGKRAGSMDNNNIEVPYEEQQQQQRDEEDEVVMNTIDAALGSTSESGNDKQNLEQQHRLQQQRQQSPYMMSCVYTGLRNFYRCRNIEEINNIINQLTTAHSVEDNK